MITAGRGQDIGQGRRRRRMRRKCKKPLV